jgi:hypothetical protein
MKKISVLSAIYIIALAQIASASSYNELRPERIGTATPPPIVTPSGQPHAQSISFDDTIGTGNAGTYNPTDHFSVDLYLTFNGYNSAGLSLWLETTADAAPHIVLTDFTYGTTFSDPIQPGSLPVGFTLLQGTGLYTTPNPSDLGALTKDPFQLVGPGTYFIGHLSIDLSGLAPGIYTLQTDATSPHRSEVISVNGPEIADENLPVSTYTITIVPEPKTWSLIGLGILLLFGFNPRRSRAATRGHG